MSEIIAWIAAAAESDRPELPSPPPDSRETNSEAPTDGAQRKYSLQHLPVHQFPARVERPVDLSRAPGERETEQSDREGLNVEKAQGTGAVETSDQHSVPGDTAVPAAGGMEWASDPLYSETDIESEIFEEQRRRRVYRGRTAAMLKRYMRFALEAGRIPSILGGEIFRSRVTSYGVGTFEDRAIFVHDMEKCMNRLDELSRQVLARVVLQGHNHDEAARLFGCTRMTIHRNLMEALDQMADILLGVGLLEAIPVTRRESSCPSTGASTSAGTEEADAPVEKSCQGGEATDFLLSDWDDGK